MARRPSWLFAAVLALAVVPAPLLPSPAGAEVTTGGSPWSASGGSGVTWSLSGSVGQLQGTAYERVYAYPNGEKYKVSELKWDLKDVTLAGLEGSVGLGDAVRLNLGWWGAVSHGSGGMVDRDWLYADVLSGSTPPSLVTDDAWTDQSVHPNTSVDHASMVDLNLAVRAFAWGPLRVIGILGYRNDVFRWTAREGTFVYSVHGFRDTSGNFATLFGPDVVTIQYEQKYQMPYAGLDLAGDWGAFRLEGHVLGGPVTAEDHDYHALRATTFDGHFGGGTFVGAGARATYFFTARFFASLGVEYQRIDEMVGNVVASGPNPDGIGTFTIEEPDGGSVELSTVAGFGSLGYRF
jgi:outer membrane protease